MLVSKVPNYDAYGLFRALHSHNPPSIRISWDYHPTFMLISGRSQGLLSTYEQAHVDLDLLTLASLYKKPFPLSTAICVRSDLKCTLQTPSQLRKVPLFLPSGSLHQQNPVLQQKHLRPRRKQALPHPTKSRPAVCPRSPDLPPFPAVL